MSTWISVLMFVLAGVGLVLGSVQVVSLIRHLGRIAPGCHRCPGITILKPICGVDDNLMANLRTFAELDYPGFEVLLGVRDTSDPAYRIARHAAACWPAVMRVVLQRGEPGFNPKVNQLITLAAEARHDLLVVSDSNVAVHPGYLVEVAAAFEDPAIGILTHPIAGMGEASLGALLDNANLCAAVSPGIVSANLVAHIPLVVGKSMALRRRDLRALGGFDAFKDVLAEDFVMGRAVARELGLQIAVANRPVANVTRQRTLRSFLDRYTRWSIMQRRAVGLTLYASQVLLFPLPLALAGLALEPSRRALAAVLLCVALKAMLDQLAARSMRLGGLPLVAYAVLPMKDLLLFYTWLSGFVRSEINWRGNRLEVLDGSRLVPVGESAEAIFGQRA